MKTAQPNGPGCVVEVWAGLEVGACWSGRSRPCPVLCGLMRIEHVAVEPPPRQPQTGLAANPRMQRFGRRLDDITRFCREGKIQMGMERVHVT